ncbi:hypothetical protein J5N97_014602 [Dioscorea zingiberensis]|uniref:RRM domain-containing protein n=1 Tax=Dioscorea zingiberensis TaxID=325984 RepID=A0A9D5HJX7_9LILI|nr:hypothetical protein J5N97_014602 [Dioscorea zingiberensis]
MRDKMKPLLHLFLFLLFFSCLLSPGSLALRIPKNSHVFEEISGRRDQMVINEELVKERMDFETHDYPGSGANNRHDPRAAPPEGLSLCLFGVKPLQTLNPDPSPSLLLSSSLSFDQTLLKEGRMGAKAKKSLKKKMIKKVVAKRQVSLPADEPSNFLPLEGGLARKQLEGEKPVKDVATVLYIGRIPHGFYEDQMEGFFKQFGKIKRLRIARNRKTGKSKHYGYIEFEDPEVARVVADEIHGYLLFEHRLQLHLIPPERVHPKLWKGRGRCYKPFDWKEFARKRHNKDRTIEEHEKMVQGILKRNGKRCKRIEAAGIEYECPDFVGMVPKAKKIKFDDEDED